MKMQRLGGNVVLRSKKLKYIWLFARLIVPL